MGATVAGRCWAGSSKELVISGTRVWNMEETHDSDAGWRSPSSSPGLPSGQGCARKPPKGEILWYFLLNCLCCLESLWVWRTVLTPAFSGLRLGQRGLRGWDLWEIGA